MSNVIKVLSVINFGFKCNENPNSNRITVGRNFDKVAVTLMS